MYDIRCSDDKRIFNIHTDGIPHLSVDMLDSLGVPNLFTTRFISYDPETGTGQKGLRLAVMKDEEIAEASPVCRKNRDILAHQLGSSISMECITDQKHTNYVHTASREDLGIPTVGNFALHRHYVDGVVTDIPDVLLTAFGGDCPPVYIADPVRKAIGLVHAGWRGTLGRIPLVAVANMVVRFGCDPSDMYAAVGPGICRDCYEMGDEVYDLFAGEWSEAEAEKIFSKYPAGQKRMQKRSLRNTLHTMRRAAIYPEESIIWTSGKRTACRCLRQVFLLIIYRYPIYAPDATRIHSIHTDPAIWKMSRWP